LIINPSSSEPRQTVRVFSSLCWDFSFAFLQMGKTGLLEMVSAQMIGQLSTVFQMEQEAAGFLSPLPMAPAINFSDW